MDNLGSAINQLEQECASLASQLERLNNALSALNVQGTSEPAEDCPLRVRAGIAAVQRARWAKVKGKVVPITAGKKGKLSAVAIAHIRAAQKARWAKWKRERKAG
jgi:hypothetical protein